MTKNGCSVSIYLHITYSSHPTQGECFKTIKILTCHTFPGFPKNYPKTKKWLRMCVHWAYAFISLYNIFLSQGDCFKKKKNFFLSYPLTTLPYPTQILVLSPTMTKNWCSLSLVLSCAVGKPTEISKRQTKLTHPTHFLSCPKIGLGF